MKRKVIVSCLNSIPIERARKRQNVHNKAKNNTIQYSFTVNSNKIKLCKLTFLNTLAVSNTVVVNCLKNCQSGGAVKLDQRGESTPTNKIPQNCIDNIVQYISAIL